MSYRSKKLKLLSIYTMYIDKPGKLPRKTKKDWKKKNKRTFRITNIQRSNGLNTITGQPI